MCKMSEKITFSFIKIYSCSSAFSLFIASVWQIKFVNIYMYICIYCVQHVLKCVGIVDCLNKAH